MKFLKKLISVTLAAMLLMAPSVPAMAEEAADEDVLDASKTAERTENALEYEITLSVPGDDTNDGYSEIIVMVDGSISNKYTDYYEGGSEFAAEMSLIKSIGNKTLRSDGKVHLTVMGFGFSGSVVDTFTSPDDLERLDDLTSDDFLYGVSATNGEGAMNFIYEYLTAQPEQLRSSIVVFASDGETNLDDEPFPLYDWRDNKSWWGAGSVAALVEFAAECQVSELRAGYEPIPATARLYPDECAAIASAKKNGTNADVDASILALSAAITDDTEKGAEFIDAVFSDAMAAYKNDIFPDGMDYSEAYPSSHLEHAMVDFYTNGEKLEVPLYESYGGKIATNSKGEPLTTENCGFIFYVTVYRFGGKCADNYNTSRPDPDPITNKKIAQKRTTGLRAAAACDRVCGIDTVKKFLLFGYPANTSTQPEHWMNPDATSETTDGHVTSPKAEFHFAEGSVEALEDFDKNFAEILKTEYMDPYIVDPMSEWVNFDPEKADIRIYDGDLCIYSRNGGGWLIDESERPVKTKEPVKLELDPDTGTYVLTWYVKEGKLSIIDQYRLRYLVTVNTEADGYVAGEEYPANGDTFLIYGGEDEPVTVPVAVPQVAAPITVTKKWSDEGERPHGSVTVCITADGAKVAPVTVADGDGSVTCDDGNIVLGEENGWTAEIIGLPAKDGNGRTIEYEAVELYGNSRYRCTVTGSAFEGFVLTNTYIEEETVIHIGAGTPETGPDGSPDGERNPETGAPVLPAALR